MLMFMRYVCAAGFAKGSFTLIFHVTVRAIAGVNLFRGMGYFLPYATHVFIGLPVPVIFDGRVQGVGPQVGAMQLVFGQAFQSLGHVIVANLHGLVQGLAFGQLREHAGNGDGGAAAKGLELDVLDDIILDFEVNIDHITANGIANLTNAVGFGYFPDIARIFKMI
jgi:hypothetical protein